MITGIDELIRLLDETPSSDTRASEALWIRFSQQKTERTVEYRTADGNQILHVYLGNGDALVGIEIFP